MAPPRCESCGKEMQVGERAGSITSYMFGANKCVCGERAAGKTEVRPPAGAADGEEFCPRCGLVKVDGKKVGSLTGYLFQDTRCRCTEDEEFDSVSMSQRFWKLHGETHVGGAAKSTRANLQDGATIAGVYQIIKLIGRGGMGEVYLARHSGLGKRCAIKVIPPEQVTEVGWQRFQIEARLFAKLDQINLVRVTDLGIHDGCLPFYAMDYVEGRSLADLIAERGRLPLAQVLAIFMQVCDGVDYAHRNGIIHRDLKPANIMISGEGDKLVVKVLDFGLAKLTQQDRGKQSLTAVGEIFGSPFYMSPEQCAGEKVDNRSDIYSVGCTIYECLTERPPFTGTIAAAIMNAHENGEAPTLAGAGLRAPDAMETVLAKLLRKNPAERYATMSELRGDLEKVAAGQTVDPIYVSRSRPGGRVDADEGDRRKYDPDGTSGANDRPRLSPIWALLAVLIVLGGTAAVAFSISQWSKSEAHKTYKVKLLPSPTLDYKPPKIAADSYKWDGKPFYKGIQNVPGQGPMKVWVFPVNLNEVTSSMTGRGRARHEMTSSMAGTVRMPADSYVSFFPNADLVKKPDFVQGLTDGNFDEMKFVDTSAAEFRELAPLLTKFKSLKALSFAETGRGVTMDDQYVEFINNFPALERLTIDCIDDGGSFKKIKTFRRLSAMEIHDVNVNLGQLFTDLHGSPGLIDFKLWNHPVTRQAMEDLASCPRLKYIQFGPSTLEDTVSLESLKPLARLRELHGLLIPYLEYSPQLIDFMSGFKYLREFKFGSPGSWTPGQLSALKKALPKDCKVMHVIGGTIRREDIINNPTLREENIRTR